MSTFSDVPFRRWTEEESEMIHGGDKRLASLLPYVFGLWLDTLFMGIILVLFGVWLIKTRPTERKILQGLVLYLFIATLAGTGWYLTQVKEAFTVYFGTYLRIGDMKYVRWFGLISTGTRIPTIAFLLHRSYMLWDRRKVLLAIVIPLMLVVTACNLTSIFLLRHLSDAPKAKRFLAIATVAEVVADFTLTISIIVRLRQMKSGFVGTDRLITRMVRTLMESQLPQAMSALMFLIISTAFARTPRQMIVLFYPKIGVICTLIVLNSRSSLEDAHKSGAYANRFVSGSATGNTYKAFGLSSLRTKTEPIRQEGEELNVSRIALTGPREPTVYDEKA